MHVPHPYGVQRDRCTGKSAAARQNGAVRGVMRGFAVLALLVVAPDLSVAPAHAQVPELAACVADAELVPNSTGTSVTDSSAAPAIEKVLV